MHVVTSQRFIDRTAAVESALLIARAVTDAALGDAVQAVIDRHLEVDYFSVFDQRPAQPPTVVAAGGRDSDGVSPALASIYAMRFFRWDAEATWAQERQPANQVAVHSRKARDVQNTSYRHECYDRPGITERLTIRSGLSGTWRTLHLYRKHRSPAFTQADMDHALDAASCILAALPAERTRERATDSRNRVALFDERLRRLPGRLTERERQVCARALVGLSVEGTALDLGVAPTSVATYRKRAYEKLGVTSQTEIFGLLC